MAKREKRPPRLAWFALDVDAFLEDERMQILTNKEKGAWLLMLVRGFRNKGMIITDPEVISEQTGLKNIEAKTLLAKLLQNTLLIPLDEVYKAVSNRLVDEYTRAEEAYNKFSSAGKESARKNGITNLKLVKSEANDVA